MMHDLMLVDFYECLHCIIGELHAIIQHLMQTNPPDVEYASSKHIVSSFDSSLIAMAYIVLVLKLFFGLNDQVEQ